MITFPFQYKNNTAIITPAGETYTYGKLLNLSNDIYAKIKQRSLVFCLCDNSVGSLCGYISFVSNKVVPVMLDSYLSKEMLKDLMLNYRPDYLWLPNERVREFPNEKVLCSELDYSLIKLTSGIKNKLHDSLALLLTTSGSTGSPKLVRVSYTNLESNATSIAKYLSIDANERPITTLPMNYSFGLSIINSHLLKGSTILLTSKSLMQKEFWTFLKEQNATSLSGVPYTYEILKKLRFFRMDLPSLKTLTQAGGKLNNELNKEFSEFAKFSNKQFIVMYGQTEATARMSYLPPEYSLTKLGSMGVAIPGGEFSLIDESGSTIEGHEIIGELVYKGKNVSMGYAECGSDLKKEDENKGILFTGDIAKRDKDGFYYIIGRKKRFIKLYGNRVNLDEMERLLKNIISDCAYIGEDDHMKIFITDKKRKKEVRDFISAQTGIHYSAFTIIITENIPKNASGKTIYKNLDLLL